MTFQDTIDLVRAKNFVEKNRVCMLTTITPEGRLVSRPMTALQMDDQGNLWFLASETAEQTVSLDFDENVNLGFADVPSGQYLSVTGSAKVLKDPKKTAELWDSKTAAWYPDGMADPMLCLIRVHPHAAEFWDGISAKPVLLHGAIRSAASERHAADARH